MQEYIVIVDELGRYGYKALDMIYRTRCYSEVQAARPARLRYPQATLNLDLITDGFWYGADMDIVAVTVIQVNAVPFKPAL